MERIPTPLELHVVLHCEYSFHDERAYSYRINLLIHLQLWDLCEFGFIYFFYVETKGPTLENIARIFDGEDAVAHIDLHQVEKEIHQGQHAEDIDDLTNVSPKSAV